MPIQVLMPALSPTMEKGNLAKWLKKEGEAIKSGDVIAEIETDKATMEVEATDEGTLGRILVPEGTADVAVNTPIATILSDGESDADLGKADSAEAAEGAGGKSRSRRRRFQGSCGIPFAGRRGQADDFGPETIRRAGDGDSRRSRHSGRHRDGDHDHPRGAARRHGRGDAPRRRRLPDGRGGRRISGRLQGIAGTAGGIRCAAGDRYPDHRARFCRRRRRRVRWRD